MNCPTCDSSDIDDTKLYTATPELYSEELCITCGCCGCAFLPDGEVISKWEYCSMCANYVAPEDKPKHGEPLCIRCSGLDPLIVLV